MNESSQVDDPSLDLPLPDELILWRRVPKEKFVFVTDVEGMTHFRPSSDTFADSRDGSSMSVFDSSSCGGLDRILHGHEQFGDGWPDGDETSVRAGRPGDTHGADDHANAGAATDGDAGADDAPGSFDSRGRRAKRCTGSGE